MLKLTLATPTKKLYVGEEISEIFVPAEMGELNILPGHAPLMSTLTTGVMKFKKKNEDSFEKIAISWGYIEVFNDHISLLADAAEKSSEISAERAREAYHKAQERLNMAGLGENELDKYQRKLERAQNRLAALEQ